MLHKAGVDTRLFSAHSTRSASVSAAKVVNISAKTILETAGWANAQTFAKFFDKPIIVASSSDNFGNCLLKALDVQ